jgi:hypothetical protein
MCCTAHRAHAISLDQHESKGFYNRDGVCQCDLRSEASNMIQVYLNCISKTVVCFVRLAAGLATRVQVSSLASGLYVKFVVEKLVLGQTSLGEFYFPHSQFNSINVPYLYLFSNLSYHKDK